MVTPHEPAPPAGPTSPWAERLLALSSVLLVVSFLIAWCLQVYFRIDVAAALSYVADDGWCLPTTEGFGIHCFGDFHQFIAPAPSDYYPITSSLSVSPAGSVISDVFGWLATATSIRFSLATYLLLSCLLILAPFAITLRHRPLRESLPFLMVLGVLTMPFITLMDRGNNLSFAVPGLFLFAFGLKKARYDMCTLGIVLSAVVKPQFLILVIALLAIRQYRRAALTMVYSGLAVLATFVFYAGPVDRFQSWVSSISRYSAHIPLASDHNYSISGAIFRTLSLPIAPEHLRVIARHLLSLHTTFPGLLALLLFSAVLIAFGRRMDPTALAFVVLCNATFLVGTVNAYYTAVALPIAALIVSSGLPGGTSAARSRQGRLRDLGSWSILIAVSIALAPMVFPTSWPALDQAYVVNAWSILVPASWYLASLLVVLGSITWPEGLRPRLGTALHRSHPHPAP
jgi:hypothetical protein